MNFLVTYIKGYNYSKLHLKDKSVFSEINWENLTYLVIRSEVEVLLAPISEAQTIFDNSENLI